ncbi:MAG: hypothetical protein V4719_18115 [Planctomycetota bacterium]
MEIKMHFQRIGFTVVAEPDSDAPQHRLNFRAYKTVNAPADSDLVPVYLHGSISSDHRSNWHFDEQDNRMIHFSSVDESDQISILFRRMYELAEELIPEWKGK